MKSSALAHAVKIYNFFIYRERNIEELREKNMQIFFISFSFNKKIIK